MIIGSDRDEVIENIKRAAESGNFFAKVETHDPVLTTEESNAIINKYLKERGTASFKMRSCAARGIANVLTDVLCRDTEIVGIEKAQAVSGGAIITSNHFSPVENTGIRLLARRLGRKRINIVSQETNLAMPGIIGFLMNYADIIPISGNIHYTQREFADILKELLTDDEFVLIYPEEEMWFNYRKPRPPKLGAFYYAARLGFPVISCFIEQRDLPEQDTAEFRKVKFIVHVLDVLYPDPSKSVWENSALMSAADYRLKKEIYEKVYSKPLDYTFDPSDIAGWTGTLEKSGAEAGTEDPA